MDSESGNVGGALRRADDSEGWQPRPTFPVRAAASRRDKAMAALAHTSNDLFQDHPRVARIGADQKDTGFEAVLKFDQQVVLIQTLETVTEYSTFE